jgi:intraflagellar transport protein 122
VRFLDLVNRLEAARRDPAYDNTVALAEIKAYQGEFAEAARLYVKAGRYRTAIEMFLDIRDWDRAKQLVEKLQRQGVSGLAAEAKGDASGVPSSAAGVLGDGGEVNMGELLRRQAEWLLANGEKKAAAEMFWGSKDLMRAIVILGDAGLLDDLMEKVAQARMRSRPPTCAL